MLSSSLRLEDFGDHRISSLAKKASTDDDSEGVHYCPSIWNEILLYPEWDEHKFWFGIIFYGTNFVLAAPSTRQFSMTLVRDNLCTSSNRTITGGWTYGSRTFLHFWAITDSFKDTHSIIYSQHHFDFSVMIYFLDKFVQTGPTASPH